MDEFFAGSEGLDSILIKLAEKWNTLDFEQQRFIATTAAGSRQQSRFIALMADYGRTQELVAAANNSAGAGAKQYEKTLDSLESKLAKLKNAFDQFIMGLTNNELISAGVDFLTGFLTTVNSLIDAISGGNGLIKSVATLGLTIGALSTVRPLVNSAFDLIAPGVRETVAKQAGYTTEKTQSQGTIIHSFANTLGKEARKGRSDRSEGFYDSFVKNERKELFEKTVDAYNKAEEEKLRATEKRIAAERKLEETKNAEQYDQESYLMYVEEAEKELEKAKDLENQAIEKVDLAFKDMNAADSLRVEFKEFDSENIDKFAISAVAAGVAISGLGEALEKTGVISEDTARWIKGLGAVLTSFGTLLPTIVKGAKDLGVTFGKAGIQIGEAGAIAKLGWIEFAAVITALGAIVVGFVALQKEMYNASAIGQLEKATTKFENLKNAADEAKEAYDNLLNSQTDYNELQDTLDNLTVGTQEWKKALIEANTQVLELLKTYPELVQYIERGQDGQLTINERGFDSVIESQYQSMLNAQYVSAGAQQDVYRAEALWGNSVTVEADILDSSTHAILQEFEGLSKVLSPEELREEVKAKNLDGEVERLVLEAVEQYAAGMMAANEKIAASQLSLFTAAASDNVLDYEYSSELLNAFSQVNVDDRSGAISATDLARGAGGITNTAEIAQDLGIQLSGTYKHQLKQIYSKLTGAAIDSIDLTKEELREAISDIYNNKNAVEDLEVFTNYLKGLDDEIQRQLIALFGGDTSTITLDEFKWFLDIGLITPDGKVVEEEVLHDKLAENSETEWFAALEKMYGVEGAAELAAALEVPLDRLSEQFSAAMDFKNLYPEVSHLKVATLANLSEQVKQMAEEDAEAYVGVFNEIVTDSDLSKEDRLKLENYLSTLDLTNLSDLIDATEYLRDLGFGNNEVEDFFNAATNGVDIFIGSVEEAYAISQKLIGLFKNADATIKAFEEGTATSDDVNALIAAGFEDLSKYLIITEDGFKIVGDAALALAEKLMLAEAAATTELVAQEKREQIRENQDIASELFESGFFSFENGEYSVNELDAVQIKAANREFGLGFNQTDFMVDGKVDVEAFENAIQERLKEIVFQANNAEELLAINQKSVSYSYGRTRLLDELPEGADAQAVSGSLEREAEIFDLDAAELRNYYEYLLEVLGKSEIETAKLASEMFRYKKAADLASESGEEWVKTLRESSSRATPEAMEAVEGIRETLALLYGDDFSNLEITEPIINAFDDFINAWEAGNVTEEISSALDEVLGRIPKVTLSSTAEEMYNYIRQYAADIEAITEQSFTMDIRAFFTGEDALKGLVHLLIQSKATAEEIDGIFRNMGYDVNYTTEYVSLINGKYEVQGVSGISITPLNTIDYSGLPEYSSSGGGGGGSDSDKAWENPYDELYNLSEDLNAVLREREKIESEYDDILEDRTKTSRELIANSLKQIANLRKEIALQEELRRGRLNQVANLGSERYIDSEGNETTYSAMGVEKYAVLNTTNNEINIDWDAIDQIVDENLGSAVEAYISRLEELRGQLVDIDDAIDEANDSIQEIMERGKQEYLDFEQTIYDALVQERQNTIDEYQAISDAQNEANTSILDALRESIDLERQIRDNTEKEEDIAEMEARLAYLRRDTSGANVLEIQQLEQELADARQEYGDTLIDQELDRLNDIEEKANEQRQQQIDLLQAQLDYQEESGAFWDEVSKILDESIASDGALSMNSRLVSLLQNTEAFFGMSEFGRMNWIDELITDFMKAQEGYDKWKIEQAEEKGEVVLGNGQKLTFDGQKWNDSEGGSYSDISYDALTETFTASGYVANERKVEPEPPAPVEPPKNYPYGKASDTKGIIGDGAYGEDVKAIQYALNELGYGNTGTQSLDGDYGVGTRNAVAAFQAAMGISADGIVGDETRKKFKLKEYKAGGLADSTGLAWLDGTKAKPEMVLDAVDTKNLIELKDILGSILTGANSAPQSSGDVNIEVNIKVDELGSSYDTEQLAADIKRTIVEEAQYRNVNSINFLR